jgi:UDP-3-O-[3-hydroxymyristoyl] glucosamine N-acyltransferase
VEIEENVEIGSNTCIDRGALGNTIVRSGAKIDNLVHLAHNVVVGCNALVIANSMIGGSTVIEEGAWIAPSVSVMNQVSIGKSSILGMGAVVIKDVADGAVMVGNPAKALEKKIG